MDKGPILELFDKFAKEPPAAEPLRHEDLAAMAKKWREAPVTYPDPAIPMHPSWLDDHR